MMAGLADVVGMKDDTDMAAELVGGAYETVPVEDIAGPTCA